MRNLIEIIVNSSDFSDVTEYYESQGFSFISSKIYDRNELLVTFEGSRDSIADVGTFHRAVIQFEDGTESPLYIKRERNFWED